MCLLKINKNLFILFIKFIFYKKWNKNMYCFFIKRNNYFFSNKYLQERHKEVAETDNKLRKDEQQ